MLLWLWYLKYKSFHACCPCPRPPIYISRVHIFDFWWRSAAMTPGLPWTSVGVATGYRGNWRVSTERATVHGASTANATVVATARATVLSVANSVVLAMPTNGRPRRLPRQLPRTLNHSYIHGHLRPSAAIATAILRYTAVITEIRGNCHGNFRGRQTTKLSTAIHGNSPIQGNCHRKTR